MSEMNEKDLEQVVGGDAAEKTIGATYALMIKRDCRDCSATNKFSCQDSLKALIREHFTNGAVVPLHCPWKH